MVADGAKRTVSLALPCPFRPFGTVWNRGDRAKVWATSMGHIACDRLFLGAARQPTSGPTQSARSAVAADALHLEHSRCYTGDPQTLGLGSCKHGQVVVSRLSSSPVKSRARSCWSWSAAWSRWRMRTGTNSGPVSKKPQRSQIDS